MLIRERKRGSREVVVLKGRKIKLRCMVSSRNYERYLDFRSFFDIL